MGSETQRGSGEESSYKEGWPDCGGSAETGRVHEAALGRKTERRSGEEKSGLISTARRYFEGKRQSKYTITASQPGGIRS
jgi:hypothetical protein